MRLKKYLAACLVNNIRPCPDRAEYLAGLDYWEGRAGLVYPNPPEAVNRAGNMIG